MDFGDNLVYDDNNKSLFWLVTLREFKLASKSSGSAHYVCHLWCLYHVWNIVIHILWVIRNFKLFQITWSIHAYLNAHSFHVNNAICPQFWINDISIVSRHHFCSRSQKFFFFIHLLALLVLPDVWLSWFTTIQPASEQQSFSALSTYAALVFGAFAMAMIRAVIFFSVSLRSSQNLHSRLVTCLLKAPVLFFNTNPAGRILNRCSKDISCMDELLPRTFLSAIQPALK